MIPEIPFDPPPRNVELVNGDTHVFCASLVQPLSRLEQFAETLSVDERARAARFKFKQDRDHFLAGRGQLREILGWLLHTGPTQLSFVYGEHGKPQLASPVAGRFLYFNLSHSDSLVVYAISARHQVGIDVECIRSLREVEDITERFFSERERAEWRSLPTEERTAAFFYYWTGKEALLKAAGNGLNERFREIEVQWSPSETISSPGLARVTTCASNFSLHLLMPARGYAGAIATENSETPYIWRWCPNEHCRSGEKLFRVSVNSG